MAYRVLSVFHPENDISQIFKNHAFLNADLCSEKKDYFQFLPNIKLYYQDNKILNQDIQIDVSSNNFSLGYQYECWPFQYRFGYGTKINKLKMGIDFLTDDCFTADQSITSLDTETTPDHQSVSVSRTIISDDWKFGYQTKFYPNYQLSITDFKWQTSPLLVYRIVSDKLPLGFWIVNNWQYRGEVKNLEGVLQKSKIPTLVNNSILYQPEDWLILHLGLSTILPEKRVDLIIGSSVNLFNGVTISYQYQNQRSVFDLYINQMGISYQINHQSNNDSLGIKYSLQY